MTDSAFENVFNFEAIRTSQCQNENGVTSCSLQTLFPKTSGIGMILHILYFFYILHQKYFAGLTTNQILLIVGLTFLVVAIVVGIGIAIYVWRWKRKKDLELLGFPPKNAAPRSTLSTSHNLDVKSRF